MPDRAARRPPSGAHPFRAAWLAAALALIAPAGARGEQTLGVTGGAALGLSQDVRVSEGSGPTRTVATTEGTGVAVGPLGGLTYTLWGANWGLQLEGLYWRTSVQADRPGGGEVRVDQERAVALLSVLGRLHLRDRGGAFGYLGAGVGVVVTGVSPGQTEVGPGVGALAGVALPLAGRLRLRLEARYLVTADVDAGTGSGLQAETSGHSAGNLGHLLFGPHLDAQFVPILIGLDWVF